MSFVLDSEHSLQQLRLQNQCEANAILYLEPWGDQLTMPPGSTFQIDAYGPRGDCLEVIFHNDHVTIYGWSGSVISVFRNNAKVWDTKIPAPKTPRPISS